MGRGLGQGWSVSPLLFNIFIDDLIDELKRIENVSLCQFADDTTPVGSEKIALKDTVNCVENWQEKNKLPINESKTDVIQVHDSLEDTDFEKEHNRKYGNYNLVK